MKKAVIFGAGQAGNMVRKLLPGDIEVIAFADNRAELVGTNREGVPVIGVESLLRTPLDIILVAILNKEAGEQVRTQLLELGFSEAIIKTISPLREYLDIRLATLRLLAQEIKSAAIPGAVAELGVFTGEFAAQLNSLFPERNLYLFDTFAGFDERDVAVERQAGYSQAQTGKFKETSPDMVRRKLPNPAKAIFKVGYFPATAGDIDERFALVSIDADLYQPIYEGMKFFYPRLNRGGCLIIHDYNNQQFKGAGEAVRRFCREQMIFPVPLCDLHGTAVIIK